MDVRAVGTERPGRACLSSSARVLPSFWQEQKKYLQISKGCGLILAPLDFHTFLRPCISILRVCHVLKKMCYFNDMKLQKSPDKFTKPKLRSEFLNICLVYHFCGLLFSRFLIRIADDFAYDHLRIRENLIRFAVQRQVIFHI